VTARQKRLAIIVGILLAVSAATALVVRAFRSNLVFFYSPTQVASHEAPENRLFRIGGLVVAGSLKREGVDVSFTVTDLVRSMPVRYRGILPDLFKEGKGVVAQGKLGPDGVFTAQEVLAKHDENYMPPEAAAALKQASEHGGMMKTDRTERSAGKSAGKWADNAADNTHGTMETNR
jgi:cytochrome c-type biogenesis protein CcmE